MSPFHHGCKEHQVPTTGRCHRRRCEESDSENDSGCQRMRSSPRRGPHHFGHHGMRGGPVAHRCMFREQHQPGHFGHHHGMHGSHHHGHSEINARPNFGCRRGFGGRGHFNRHHETSGRPSFAYRGPHHRANQEHHGSSQDEENHVEGQVCRFAQQRRAHSVDIASIGKHQCQHRKH